MEIQIKGRFEPNNRSFYTERERLDLGYYIGNDFVFVGYLTEEVCLGDVFVLEDGTEIILKEIKLQFPTKEPLDSMGHGWKFIGRFENLDLNKIPAVKDWFSDVLIGAKKKV